jgi:hypothetical protein
VPIGDQQALDSKPQFVDALALGAKGPEDGLFDLVALEPRHRRNIEVFNSGNQPSGSPDHGAGGDTVVAHAMTFALVFPFPPSTPGVERMPPSPRLGSDFCGLL